MSNASATSSSSTGLDAPLSVLVVDDDEFVCSMLSRMVAALGATQIDVAGNGDEAIARIRDRGPFDVILLDLMMPGVDGIEFLRHLAPMQGNVDLILTSSLDRKLLDTAESLARAHALSVLGVLPKPVRSQALKDLFAQRSRRQVAVSEAALVTAEQLSAALREGWIVPYFQPKMCAQTGALRSVEALARWVDPVLGVVTPDRFVRTAEESGQVDELAMQVSQRSLEALGRWQERGFRPDLQINLSACTLARVDFPDRMSELAARHGVDPDRVTFEITETALIGRLSQSLDTLTRMRLKGFHLAIDDFGTGYSTLSQLKLLPLSELKIDRGFVARMASDPEARAIVESCLDLAKRFNLISVAEGVEDEATAELLRGMGTTLLQGYLYSRPMPADAVCDWWLDRALAAPVAPGGVRPQGPAARR